MSTFSTDHHVTHAALTSTVLVTAIRGRAQGHRSDGARNENHITTAAANGERRTTKIRDPERMSYRTGGVVIAQRDDDEASQNDRYGWRKINGKIGKEGEAGEKVGGGKKIRGPGRGRLSLGHRQQVSATIQLITHKTQGRQRQSRDRDRRRRAQGRRRGRPANTTARSRLPPGTILVAFQQRSRRIGRIWRRRGIELVQQRLLGQQEQG